MCQASVQLEKEDVQRARALHDSEVQRHREQVTQLNTNIDKWKVRCCLIFHFMVLDLELRRSSRTGHSLTLMIFCS